MSKGNSGFIKKSGRRKKIDRKYLIRRIIFVAIIVLVIIIAVAVKAGKKDKYDSKNTRLSVIEATDPDYDVELLDINEYSRPGLATEDITGIVIHYTANPGTTAMNNRDYFQGLKDSGETHASSHFVVGLEGEIVQCIPTAEWAYASNDRNNDTVSIECCYVNEDGSYEQATYDSVVKLTAWLCRKFDLDENAVIRHYDVSGKACPLYYVDHPEEWERFIKDVGLYIEAYKKAE